MNSSVPRIALKLLALSVCLNWLGEGMHICQSPSAWKSSSVQSAAMDLRPAGAQFVFADLDGDRKPDLASVEMENPRSTKSSYSIQLQFGAGARAAIGVSAPAGGLQVVARDVNGDDSVDLILTSNVDANFVEVLLNDGHGNFSLAGPGAYSNVENDSTGQGISPLGPGAEQDKFASLRSPFGEEGTSFRSYQSIITSDSLAIPRNPTSLLRLAQSHLGRAPPACFGLS